MTKILIGTKNNLSIKTNRWFYYIAALGYVALAALAYFSSGLPLVSGLWVLTGLLFMLYGYFTLSEKSSLAPRLEVDEEKIAFKSSLYSSTVNIYWNELYSIKFSSFKVSFHTEDGIKPLRYTTSTDRSLEIKDTIRAYAQMKGVSVANG